MKLKLLALLALFTLPSCTVALDPNGNPRVSTDPVAIGQLADKVAQKVNHRLIDTTK